MLVLADWVHTLSPFALRFSDSAGLRWYGLAYCVGFLIAWLLLRRLALAGQLRLSIDRVTDLLLMLVLGVIVGGRLGYVLLYQPALLVDFGGGFPFWGVFRINQGGMASHGGLVGVIVAAWLFGRRNGVRPLHLLDCLALVAPIGLMLGRVANFINGELLGKVVAGRHQPGPWWSVRFPQELLERRSELPPLTGPETQQLEALVVRSIAALSGGTDGPYGQAADRAVEVALAQPIDPDQTLAGVPLLIEAIQRGHSRLAGELGPLLHARHPSQLYQAVMEGPVVLLAVWACWRLGGRSPGQAGAVFLMAYGVGRILTELYRLPDAHLHTQRLLGLSRGQWLSAGMVVAGAVLWAWARRARLSPTIDPPPAG